MRLKKTIRNALSTVAPNMKLGIAFENPRYANAEGSMQRVVITYNADIAAECGVTESAMRNAVKSVIPEDSFLKTVVFEKVYLPKIAVDQDSVDAVVASVVDGNNVTAVLRVLSEALPDRKSQAFVDAVVTALEQDSR